MDLRIEAMTASYSKKAHATAVGIHVQSSNRLSEKEKEVMILSSLMTEEKALGLYFDFNGP